MVQQQHRARLTVISDTEIELTRHFDAPSELVWRATTEPEHVRRWWGQAGSSLTVCEIDLRPGGAWRFVEWAADGVEYPFRGEYRLVAPPERLDYSFIFDVEPFSSQVCEVSLTLSEAGAGTLLTSRMRFAGKADRDGMIESGMERGANESYERLDAHLREMS
jgi:uncharacterized protein YndB with AHSA1/START domain